MDFSNLFINTSIFQSDGGVPLSVYSIIVMCVGGAI